jgi:hypothetical protein
MLRRGHDEHGSVGRGERRNRHISRKLSLAADPRESTYLVSQRILFLRFGRRFAAMIILP